MDTRLLKFINSIIEAIHRAQDDDELIDISRQWFEFRDRYPFHRHLSATASEGISALTMKNKRAVLIALAIARVAVSNQEMFE